jgi:hypothetical protein
VAELSVDRPESMAISIQVFPTMASRPCRFCLSLQEGSVFADFDVDEEGRVFLRRISFDGYGCCNGDFNKMSIDDSLFLIGAVDRGTVEDPKIEAVLRTYFEENADVLWSDALASHDLF